MLRKPALALAFALPSLLTAQQPKEIPLPTSKAISAEAPGTPRTLNTFPTEMAVSPDRRYVAILNNGYGSRESQYRQSITVLNLATNELRDFADPQFELRGTQTYFVGLAFSLDGKKLYASVASVTHPEGGRPSELGNGIAVYNFSDGMIEPGGFIKLPLLEIRKKQKFVYGSEHVREGFANPYPAGLAVLQQDGREMLLVASNLSDSVLLLDPATGEIKHRFDVSREKGIVPSRFPYRLVVSQDGVTAWCALWNDSSVVELDLRKGRVGHRVELDRSQEADRTGSHPNAVALTPDGRHLFVALATRDAIAIVDTRSAKHIGDVSTRLSGQNYEGVYPDAVGFTADGKTLFVADASADAVLQYAVPSEISSNAMPTVTDYVPTEWYPTALKVVGDDLLITSGKSTGAGPNPPEPGSDRKNKYIPTLMHGSIARLPIASIAAHADEFKEAVLQQNRLNGRSSEIAFAGGKNPIKHVIYIIKENRTFDQVLGDLGVGNGDPSLTMFGSDITPNLHALAKQFGVLDNFYDSGEVSGDGHVWSTAAINSEYNELAWPIAYRGQERMYDFEGKVGDIYPIDHDEDDIDEPGTGYLWTNIARHHLSYRHYGEFIDTEWCVGKPQASPASTGETRTHCAKDEIKPGEPLPPNVGDPKGGPSPYPWPIPMIAGNKATKRELRGHFDANFADFRTDYPDQLRVDEFLNEFDGFVKARQSGKSKPMPSFVLLRLPQDHTAGTKSHQPTPQAAVADNDLAVGRVIDALSHSPYWNDTAVFVLEDDAQDGPDHVDAHRSIAFVVSKYAPRQEKPYLEHNFYTTVNVIRTMESLLGLPPMNHNDGQAALMSPLFAGDGSQPPYQADYRNRDNQLIYTMNGLHANGADESAKMDFSKPDRADPQKLNEILWRVTKGETPMPEPKHTLGLR